MHWERWSSKCFSGATDNARPGASLPSQSMVRKPLKFYQGSLVFSLLLNQFRLWKGGKYEKYEKFLMSSFLKFFRFCRGFYVSWIFYRCPFALEYLSITFTFSFLVQFLSRLLQQCVEMCYSVQLHNFFLIIPGQNICYKAVEY